MNEERWVDMDETLDTIMAELEYMDRATTGDGKTVQQETVASMAICTMGIAAGISFLLGVGTTLLVQFLLRLAQMGAV